MAKSDVTEVKSPPLPEDLPVHQRARRDRIVQAAIELLQERDYEAIQIRDVAELADVALATLYRYFTSKEHLYAAALLEWSRTDEIRHRARGRNLQTDADRLRYLLLQAVRAVGRRPQLMRAEMVLEVTPDPNARILFEQFAKRHQGELTDALKDTDPALVPAIVEATSAVMAMRLRGWALGRSTIKDVEASVNRVVDLVLPPDPDAS